MNGHYFNHFGDYLKDKISSLTKTPPRKRQRPLPEWAVALRFILIFALTLLAITIIEAVTKL